MTDYTKLVQDLRAIADELDCTYCGIKGISGGCKSCVLYDAADAIEALDAKADYWMGQAQEEYEKRLRQMPKRGEWIDRYDEHDKPFFKRKYVCSACGNWNTYGKSNYCPKCGAKMEVQE
jgi:DNA-directed RNA polymerase subunit RPC12/RpoP